jgi:hypothetical protein
MIDHIHPTKAIVTVTEMARMVGLSRARFYQLIGSAFPWPIYDISTRRPHFTEEMQAVCLEVRRRNCGVDGKPVMFYARRWSSPSKVVSPRPTKLPSTPKVDNYAELVDAVRSLGLMTTSAQVSEAVKELFPMGTASLDQGEVIRSVFVHLKRRNTRDSVGR